MFETFILIIGLSGSNVLINNYTRKECTEIVKFVRQQDGVRTAFCVPEPRGEPDVDAK